MIGVCINYSISGLSWVVLGIFAGFLIIWLIVWMFGLFGDDFKMKSNMQGSWGRMNTPPRIESVNAWENLNPAGYSGRMNTPSKVEITKSWDDFNEPGIIGRMNTPGPIPDKIFCSNCGKLYTPLMRQQLIYRKPYFCEYCGTKGQFPF